MGYEMQQLQMENKLLRAMKKYDLLSERASVENGSRWDRQLYKYKYLLNGEFYADGLNR